MDTKTPATNSPKTPGQGTNHQDALNLTHVYHVGDLSGERKKPHISYEGKGISISVHPNTWLQIMRGDGAATHETLHTYELANPHGEFYYIDPTKPLQVERDWCLENQFVRDVPGYRVTYTNEFGDTSRMEFYSKETALIEAESRNGKIDPATILSLGPKGISYWLDAFRQPPESADPIVIEGLLPVWYAEANGFDGVWWDEEFDPQNYSAPRGVVFQNQLDGWEKTIHQTSKPPYLK